MIYLDNSATSLIKPKEVYSTMLDCIKNYAANPGRSGHRLSAKAAEKVFECRENLCEMFGANDPNRFIFTQNATESLNLAIKGILNSGDHVVLTQMEHNSVIRPVFTLESENVSHTVAEADVFGRVSPESVKNAIKPNTKLIIATHVSNVCGTVNDIEKIGKIAKEHGIAFLVDAAQSAGVLPIDIKKQNITFLSLTGHKALLGPQGTGALYVGDSSLVPLKTGGTGSYSKLPYQPDDFPDKYESGTLNTVGICGLNEGIKFIKKAGPENIFEHEMHLTARLLENLSVMRKINVQGYMSTTHRSGVVSITSDKKPPSEISHILNTEYDIAVRSGYHCAPFAHKALGTFDTGSVRISLGAFNTKNDVDAFCSALYDIVK